MAENGDADNEPDSTDKTTDKLNVTSYICQIMWSKDENTLDRGEINGNILTIFSLKENTINENLL